MSCDGSRLKLREAIDYASAGIGHLTLIGAPDQIADEMVIWLTSEGADGFNLMPHVLPQGLDDSVDLFVPALQKRGVVRDSFTPPRRATYA